MQVAALEAVLLAMCFLYSTEIRRTATYKDKRFKRKRSKALDFNLYQLIAIADELSWFPAKRVRWGGKRGTLADFAHEIRELRNFVHPGKWASERPDSTRFTKGVFGAVLEVFEVANSWLLHRVHEDLRKRLGSEP